MERIQFLKSLNISQKLSTIRQVNEDLLKIVGASVCGKKYTISNVYVSHVYNKCKRSNIKSAAKYANSKSKKAKSYKAKNKWAVSSTKLKRAYSLIWARIQ